MSSFPPAPAALLESLEARVEMLFHELDLAVRWQRPSILFAVYRSEYVCADAALLLARKLEAEGQQILWLSLEELSPTAMPVRLSSLLEPGRTIVFVHGAAKYEEEAASWYLGLDRQCDDWLDHDVRVVFWLTESQTVNLARGAPDFWALRHRVVEFLDDPTPAQILRCTLETAWQNGKNAPSSATLSEPLALGDSLLTDCSSPQDGNAPFLLTLGILHWRKGDTSQAVPLLEAALQDARNRQDSALEANCHQALALLHAASGHLDEAIEACKQALRLLPEQASLWNHLGTLYAQVGFYIDALTAFRCACEKNPHDVLAWNGLGDIALRCGFLEEALSAYSKAIELSPTLLVAWLGLSRTQARLGRLDEALNACRRALALEGNRPESWLILGDLLVRKQRRAEALQAYRRALELDPQDFQAWNEVGVLFFRQGKFKQAEEAFRQAIALQPQCGWLYANLALVCSHLGRDDEAIPLYRQGIALLSEEADKALLFSRLGDVCRRVQDEPTARTAYLHAREYGADLDWFGHDLRATPHSLLHPDEDDIPLSLPQEAVIPSLSSPYFPQPAESDAHVEVSNVPVSKEDSMREANSYVAGTLLSAPEPLLFACGALLAGEDLLAQEPEMACGAFAARAAEQAEEETVESACGAFAAEAMTRIEETVSPMTWGVPAERVDRLEEAVEMACGAASLMEATDSLQRDPLELACGASAAQEEKAAFSSYVQEEKIGAAEWNARGNAHLAAGRYEEAIAAYLHAVQSSPGCFWPYVQNLALAYQRWANQSDKTASPAEVPQAVEISLSDSLSEIRSSLLEEPAVLPEGGQEMEQPLRYRPSAASLRLMEEAQQEDATAPRREDSPSAPFLEAVWPSSTNDSTVDKALAGALGRAHDFVPASAKEWNAVGNALLRVGAYERAIAAFARAIALAPQDGWAYSNLALAYCYEKRYAEAVPLYQKSLELLRSNREKAIVWNRLGDAYRRLHEHEHARAAYQRAAELDGHSSSLLRRARMVLLGNRRN